MAFTTADELRKAEEHICGWILRGNHHDIGRFRSSDFVYCTDLFINIMELHEKGTLYKDGIPDLIALSRKVKNYTMGEIAAMGNIHTADYRMALPVLFTEAQRRVIIDAANGNLTPDDAMKRVNDIAERSLGYDQGKQSHYYDDFLSYIENLSHDIEEKYRPQGKIAEIIPVFRKGELITIAARPQIGKSAYALQIAADAALKGFKVLYFSLEMSREVMGKRTTQLLHPISAELYDSPKDMTSDDWALLYKTYDDIQNLDVIDHVRSMSQIETIVKVRQPDIAIIDQLTLISAESPRWDARTTISNATKRAKQMAMDMNVTVLALTQINRAAATQEPELHHLKESGSIEEDSDIVIMLHRLSDEEANEYREFPIDLDYLKKSGEQPSIIKVPKNRNGKTGKIAVLFEGARYRYIEPYLDMYKR